VYLLAALLCAWGLHSWMPLYQVLEWPWRWVGLLLILKGVTLAALGRIQFLKHKTSVRPFTRSDALVTAVPFEWIRNPMYTGMLLVLAGEALLFGSVGPWLVVPVMWLVLDRLFVRVEEACMQLQFGPAYEAYCARVKRWV
jgi:protein-S-isoprenylcysteine O-methyltransferase Ste14